MPHDSRARVSPFFYRAISRADLEALSAGNVALQGANAASESVNLTAALRSSRVTDVRNEESQSRTRSTLMRAAGGQGRRGDHLEENVTFFHKKYRGGYCIVTHCTIVNNNNVIRITIMLL